MHGNGRVKLLLFLNLVKLTVKYLVIFYSVMKIFTMITKVVLINKI